MKRRILGIIAALALCLGLLPGRAGAAEPNDISSTGLQLNPQEIAAGATVYQAGSGTITVSKSADGTALSVALENAVINTAEKRGLSLGSFALTDITAVNITFSGENSISAADSALYLGQGRLHSGTETTLSGTGTLALQAAGSSGEGISLGGGGYDDASTLIFQSGTVNIANSKEGIFAQTSSVRVQGTATVYISNAAEDGIFFFWNDGNHAPTCGLTVRDQGTLNISGAANGVFALCQGGTGGSVNPESLGGYIRVEDNGRLHVGSSDVGLYTNQATVSGSAEVSVSTIGSSAVAGILVKGQDLEGDTALEISGGMVMVQSNGQGGIWASNKDIQIGGPSSVTVIAQGNADPLHVGQQAQRKVGENATVTTLVADETGEIGGSGKIAMPENGTVTVTSITSGGDTVTKITAPENGGTVSVTPEHKIEISGGSTVKRGDDGEEQTVPEDGGMLEPSSGTVIRKVYTVTFNPNGGSVSPDAAETVDGKLQNLPTPSRDGYIFGGWYTDAECTTAFDFDTLVTENLTLYAKWTPDAPPQPAIVPVTGVTLNKPSLTLLAGTSERLAAAVSPSDATNKAVAWTSSDPAVATVDSSGNVTAVGPGSATITVTTADGAMTASCTVTVRKADILPDPPADDSGWENEDTWSVSTYGITIENPEHGKVTASRASAASGNTVTLTTAPDSGYVLDTLTVTDSRGKELKLASKGSGRYTFTMPGRDVTVRAAFAPIPEDTQKPCDGGASCPSRAFTDLGSAGTWYHEAVDYVLGSGLMDGFGSGLFGPDRPLTRAQFAQILYNKEGRPAAAGGSTFTDVAPNAWCAPAVTWAAERNIAGGYGNGLFGPDDNITREQLAVMLWRYAGSPGAAGRELHFSDVGQVSGYASDALRWAVENGIMSGTGSGILDPQGLATRAQAAQMLKNFMDR